MAASLFEIYFLADRAAILARFCSISARRSVSGTAWTPGALADLASAPPFPPPVAARSLVAAAEVIGPRSRIQSRPPHPVHHAAGDLAFVDGFLGGNFARLEKLPQKIVQQHHPVAFAGLNLRVDARTRFSASTRRFRPASATGWCCWTIFCGSFSRRAKFPAEEAIDKSKVPSSMVDRMRRAGLDPGTGADDFGGSDEGRRGNRRWELAGPTPSRTKAPGVQAVPETERRARSSRTGREWRPCRPRNRFQTRKRPCHQRLLLPRTPASRPLARRDAGSNRVIGHGQPIGPVKPGGPGKGGNGAASPRPPSGTSKTPIAPGTPLARTAAAAATPAPSKAPAPMPGIPPISELEKRQIGRVLTKMGKVTREQVVEALTFQRAKAAPGKNPHRPGLYQGGRSQRRPGRPARYTS